MTHETKEYQVFSTEELQNEEWIEIEEVKGIWISNLGRMKSTRGKTERILAVCPISSKDPSRQYLGYPIRVNGVQRIFYPHRLVAKYHLGADEWWNGCQIHHLDLDKMNNRKSNLICLSPSEHQRLHRALRNK